MTRIPDEITSAKPMWAATTGPFIVWRITAKKRMAAKLKAIKAELRFRKHHRTIEVGAWLRKVVLGITNIMPFPVIQVSCVSFVAFDGCGGAF